jgi:hypothetical protein
MLGILLVGSIALKIKGRFVDLACGLFLEGICQFGD